MVEDEEDIANIDVSKLASEVPVTKEKPAEESKPVEK